MQILILGCGRLGSKFAEMMSREGHDVVVVDSNRDQFRLLDADFNGVKIQGVPIDEDVLKRAGVETADGVVALTPDDNINMMACQIAKTVFHVPKVFARVQDPVREQVFYQFGVQTVCPTNMAAEEFRALLLTEPSSAVYFIDDNGLSFDYELAKEDEIGKTFGEIPEIIDRHRLGLLRNGQLLFARRDIRVERGDELITVYQVV